jgi:hypothetical protein
VVFGGVGDRASNLVVEVGQFWILDFGFWMGRSGFHKGSGLIAYSCGLSIGGADGLRTWRRGMEVWGDRNGTIKLIYGFRLVCWAGSQRNLSYHLQADEAT